MRIATWNLERPKTPKFSSEKNTVILKKLRDEDADILVLTETNDCIDLRPEYVSFSTKEPMSSDECTYTSGEKRTTIWSKYKKTREIQTSDPSTSICVGLETECGELLVYGTIIGKFGHPNKDIDERVGDWEKIDASENFCIVGDFNVDFTASDNFTQAARDKISRFFSGREITNLTSDTKGCVDHIAISKSFLSIAPQSEARIWNMEKKRHVPQLSDHIGVSISLNCLARGKA